MPRPSVSPSPAIPDEISLEQALLSLANIEIRSRLSGIRQLSGLLLENTVAATLKKTAIDALLYALNDDNVEIKLAVIKILTPLADAYPHIWQSMQALSRRCDDGRVTAAIDQLEQALRIARGSPEEQARRTFYQQLLALDNPENCAEYLLQYGRNVVGKPITRASWLRLSTIFFDLDPTLQRRWSNALHDATSTADLMRVFKWLESIEESREKMRKQKSSLRAGRGGKSSKRLGNYQYLSTTLSSRNQGQLDDVLGNLLDGHQGSMSAAWHESLPEHAFDTLDVLDSNRASEIWPYLSVSMPYAPTSFLQRHLVAWLQKYKNLSPEQKQQGVIPDQFYLYDVVQSLKQQGLRDWTSIQQAQREEREKLEEQEKQGEQEQEQDKNHEENSLVTIAHPWYGAAQYRATDVVYKLKQKLSAPLLRDQAFCRGVIALAYTIFSRASFRVAQIFRLMLATHPVSAWSSLGYLSYFSPDAAVEDVSPDYLCWRSLGSSLLDNNWRRNHALLSEGWRGDEALSSQPRDLPWHLLHSGGFGPYTLDYPTFRVAVRQQVLQLPKQAIDDILHVFRVLLETRTDLEDKLTISPNDVVRDLLTHNSALQKLSSEIQAQIYDETIQHITAYLLIRRDIITDTSTPIRQQHIRKFWRDDTTMPTLVTVTQRTGSRLSVDDFLIAFAHAAMTHMRSRYSDDNAIHGALKNGWAILLQCLSSLYGWKVRENIDSLAIHVDLKATAASNHGYAALLLEGLEKRSSYDPWRESRLLSALLDVLQSRLGDAPRLLSHEVNAGNSLPQPASGLAHPWYVLFRRISRAFQRRDLRSAQTDVKFYRCRPLSKYFAIARGELAGDCSTRQVPFRAFSPHHIYYGIFRDDTNEQVRGYITVFEAWARRRDGERLPVLCVETINLPGGEFDSAAEDLCDIFRAIAASRGLHDGLVLVRGCGTWNFRNQHLFPESPRYKRGERVRLFPADPAVWGLYNAIAQQEAQNYSAFSDEDADARLLSFLHRPRLVGQPENLAEVKRISALPRRKLYPTILEDTPPDVRGIHSVIGFISGPRLHLDAADVSDDGKGWLQRIKPQWQMLGLWAVVGNLPTVNKAIPFLAESVRLTLAKGSKEAHVLTLLAADSSMRVRLAAFQNPSTPPAFLHWLRCLGASDDGMRMEIGRELPNNAPILDASSLRNFGIFVYQLLSRHPETPPATRRLLAARCSHDWLVFYSLAAHTYPNQDAAQNTAQNTASSDDLLDMLSEQVRKNHLAAARCSNLPAKLLRLFDPKEAQHIPLNDFDSATKTALSLHPHAPAHVLHLLLFGDESHAAQMAYHNPNLSPSSKRIADAARFLDRFLPSSNSRLGPYQYDVLDHISDQPTTADTHEITERDLADLVEQGGLFGLLLAARHPLLPVSSIMTLLKHTGTWVRRWARRNPSLPANVLQNLWEQDKRDSDVQGRAILSANPTLPQNLIELASTEKSWQIREGAAYNPIASVDMLRKLSTDDDYDVRTAVASHKNTPIEILQKLLDDGNSKVRAAAMNNTSLPDEYKKQYSIKQDANKNSDGRGTSSDAADDQAEDAVAQAQLQALRDLVSQTDILPSEMSTQLEQAWHDAVKDVNYIHLEFLLSVPSLPKHLWMDAIDAQKSRRTPICVRTSVARRRDLSDEAMRILWESGSDSVLCSLASNPSLPESIAIRLARSGDTDVCTLLAQNPSISSDVIDEIMRDDESIFCYLIKNPNAPPHVVLLLAQPAFMQFHIDDIPVPVLARQHPNAPPETQHVPLLPRIKVAP